MRYGSALACLLVAMFLGACAGGGLVQEPPNVQARGLHEVASAGGVRMDMARLEGTWHGAAILVASSNGRVALAVSNLDLTNVRVFDLTTGVETTQAHGAHRQSGHDCDFSRRPRCGKHGR